MIHLRVITPAVALTEHQPMVDHILAFSKPDVRISHVFLDKGPVSIESFVDDAFTVPDLMAKAILAEREGVQGVLINCMCDPGLYATRECVSIPVVATAEVAMHTAAVLGHKFGWIDILESCRTMVEDQVARYGVASRYGSFQGIDIPVLEIEKDPARTNALLAEAALRAVKEHHADILILGCGSLIGLNEAITAALEKHGITGVPVIDPLPLAIKYLTAITEAGLSHSKKAYPKPRPKTAPTGYGLPGLF